MGNRVSVVLGPQSDVPGGRPTVTENSINNSLIPAVWRVQQEVSGALRPSTITGTQPCGGSSLVVFQPDLNNRASAARRGDRAGRGRSRQSGQCGQSPEGGGSGGLHAWDLMGTLVHRRTAGAGSAGPGEQFEFDPLGPRQWAAGQEPESVKLPGPGHSANSWTGSDG